MTWFNFVSFLSMISAAYMISPMLATSMEGMLGGDLANRNQITYQAAILRKQILNGQIELSCNGGIISKTLVLSIAECFITFDGSLGYYEYSIAVNTINWQFAGIRKLIYQIFLPGIGVYRINNIAVASIIGELDLDNNPHLSELKIPRPDESFYTEKATVSGYGFSYIKYDTQAPSTSSTPLRSSSGSHNFLKYADVIVSTDTTCAIDYTDIDQNKQFCGKMLNEKTYEPWGLCDHDGGSPLVIDNKVIGIASTTHYDCDDRIYGTAYTKVSAFFKFVNSTINKNHLPDTVILYNRRYVGHITAPAA